MLHRQWNNAVCVVTWIMTIYIFLSQLCFKTISVQTYCTGDIYKLSLEYHQVTDWTPWTEWSYSGKHNELLTRERKCCSSKCTGAVREKKPTPEIVKGELTKLFEKIKKIGIQIFGAHSAPFSGEIRPQCFACS